MKLKYKLANDDFVAFNLHFVGKSSTHWNAIRKGRVVSSVSTAAVLFLICYLGFRDWAVAGSLALIIGCVPWFTYHSQYRKQMEKSLRRMAESEGVGEAGWRRLSIEESGIREETEASVSTTGFSSILRIDETDEHVFIFIGPPRAYIIPKGEVGPELAGFLEELRRRCATEAAGTA